MSINAQAKCQTDISYYRAYEMIRGITGYGAGNGPIIAMHENFRGIADWTNFMHGADRIAIDQHPYLSFGGANQNTLAQSVSCTVRMTEIS